MASARQPLIEPDAKDADVGIEDDRRERDASWDSDAIRRLRRHAGLSQQQLADELNSRQQTISEWERGAYSPRGTAARLLTRVAEDVQFPFRGESSQSASADAESHSRDSASSSESDDIADIDAIEADS